MLCGERRCLICSQLPRSYNILQKPHTVSMLTDMNSIKQNGISKENRRPNRADRPTSAIMFASAADLAYGGILRSKVQLANIVAQVAFDMKNELSRTLISSSSSPLGAMYSGWVKLTAILSPRSVNSVNSQLYISGTFTGWVSEFGAGRQLSWSTFSLMALKACRVHFLSSINYLLFPP